MISMNFSGGYNLKIAGKPEKAVEEMLELPKTAAVSAKDIPALRPKMSVTEGDKVSAGDALFVHKGDERIQFVTPYSGTVKEIRRGKRRKLLEVVVEVDEKQKQKKFTKLNLDKATDQDVVSYLLETGAWPYFRAMPNHHIADPESRPRDIYIQTLDLEPHTPDLNFVLNGQGSALQKGVDLLRKLTKGSIYVTVAATDSQVPADVKKLQDVKLVSTKAVYPAGDPAVTSYHVAPLRKNDCAWYIDAQDLIAIANQVDSGSIDTVRHFTISGTMSTRPRYVKTHLGRLVEDLIQGDVKDGDKSFICGGVFTGTYVSQDTYCTYYGRGIHVLKEGNEREFIRFLWPGLDKYSYSRVWMSTLFPQKEYEFTNSFQGEDRACIQCAQCEVVCPNDILPQFLFKAVLATDYDEAEQLGIQDCAQCGLCNYVCPSKIDLVGTIQEGIETIIKEG